MAAGATGGMALPDLVAKLRVDWTQLTTAAAEVDKTLAKINVSAGTSSAAVADIENKSKSLSSTMSGTVSNAVTKLFGGFKSGASDASKAIQGVSNDLAKLAGHGTGIPSTGGPSGGGIIQTILGPLTNVPLLGVAAAGIGAVAAGLDDLVSKTTTYSAQVLRLSDYLHMDTGLYQTLAQGVSMFGMTQQSMTLIFERFNRTVTAGAPQLKQLGFTLADVGIQGDNITQQLM